jgi:hypothetical protein
MHYPWMKQGTHGWHMRPDVVIRTGIIEPFWTRVVSPVDVARHAIDPFIESVRPRGPAVAPSPAPEKVAAAAVKVAEQFDKGKDAVVRVGAEAVKVTATGPAPGGLIGAIVKAAQGLARGKSVGVRIGAQRVIIRDHRKPGGKPERVIVRAPIGAPPVVRDHRAQPQPPVVRDHRAQPVTARAGSAPTMLVRPTPMAVRRDQRRQPMPQGTPATQVVRDHRAAPAGYGPQPGMPYGPVMKHPFHTYYGSKMRQQTYAERPSERTTVQTGFMKQFIPAAVARTHTASRRPIWDAKRQVKVAAHSFDKVSKQTNAMAHRIARPYR